MLFNSSSGTTLVKYTRQLVNDGYVGATPASQQYADQEVKDAINDAYHDLREAARLNDTGWNRKRSYATTVADQLFYSLPADFEKMITVEIETTGQDLSSVSVSNATIKFLDLEMADLALEKYYSGVYSSPQVYFFHDQHFGISAPVGSTGAGSNSMRITYEASTTELSAVTDEPDLPRGHHRLICYKAAVILKMSRDLPVNQLLVTAQMKEVKFLRTVADRAADYDDQVYIAGRGNRGTATRMGSIKHTS